MADEQAKLATDFQRRLEELVAELRARGYPPTRLARDLQRAAKSLEEK